MDDTPAGQIAPLPAQALRRACDETKLAFDTTAELDDLSEFVGQRRAVAAIEFGVGMRRDGYNLFAMGPEGLGRHTIARRFIEQQAGGREVPPDWCYVFNFETPHRPRALRLAPGRAQPFRQDMQRLVEDLRAGIPSAFESDEYRTRRQEIESEFNDRQEKAVGAIGERAREQGIALLRTPGGFGFAPVRGDEVMNPQEYRKLPEKEQQRLEGAIAVLQQDLEQVIHQVPKWRREAQRRLRELNRQVTQTAVNSLIEEMKADYADTPVVRQYLDDMQEDVLNRSELFQQPKEGEQPTLFGIPISPPDESESPLRRYAVNVLIEHPDASAAPIVYEDHPTHDNLVGRIEHVAHMGMLSTDFTRIKAGALHRANGGYLLLDAVKVLTQPFAWEGLKRALRSREIRTESLGQALSLVSTVSLEPEPIPLDVKVVLLGQRMLYYLLHELDPEFGELFKVSADFDEEMERDSHADALYARLIATIARREKLRAFERGAVAHVIEEAARRAGDAGKLSVHMRGLTDLLRESDYWAGIAGRSAVSRADVVRAIEADIDRSSRVRERLHEEIGRGRLLIDTQGAREGQVNALAVMELGGYAFGMPHRVTARVRLGGGRVIDIERESELGGRIHSKGVLILSGFLAGRYVTGAPLSLTASLVFEQSYGGIEGDSASSAELFALLSALARMPARQDLAVTGSVNQHGDIQAIGAVNEKIEGFFDVCAARGLTGTQGVLIPRTNIDNLMLREDVVAAVADGRFHVYPIASVDEGLQLLTGTPAGTRDALGRFSTGSVNARIEERLTEFTQRARSIEAPMPVRRHWRNRNNK